MSPEPSTRSNAFSARAGSPRPSTSSARSCPPPPTSTASTPRSSALSASSTRPPSWTTASTGALPELRRLADERATEAGQADPQSLRFRYEAAQCLEQLGEPAAALAEYRALLPYYENQYVAGDPELSSTSAAASATSSSPSATAPPPATPSPASSTTWTACAAPGIHWRRRSGGPWSGWGRCAASRTG